MFLDVLVSPSIVQTCLKAPWSYQLSFKRVWRHFGVTKHSSNVFEGTLELPNTVQTCLKALWSYQTQFKRFWITKIIFYKKRSGAKEHLYFLIYSTSVLQNTYIFLYMAPLCYRTPIYFNIWHLCATEHLYILIYCTSVLQNTYIFYIWHLWTTEHLYIL